MVEAHFGIIIDPDWKTTTGGAAPTALPMDGPFYVAGVRNALTRIASSQTGRHLAASLRYHGKAVAIIPYPDRDGNAQEWWWGNQADNHSVIRFSPERGRSPCGAELKKRRPASLPNEVLFHELVHSLRRVSGRMKGWKLRNGEALTGFDNIEEFIAILVTNIYISDVTNRYKTGLRADWSSHSPLDAKLADSYRFFLLGTKAFNLVATLCDDNPGFTRMLSKVRAHFNPIAAYHQNRNKAFEMAAQGDSERTFEGITPIAYMEDPSGAWVRIFPYKGPPPRRN